MSPLEEDIIYISDIIRKLRFNDKRFFITGSTGMIGSLLCKSIIKANAIYGLNNHVVAMVRNIDKAYRVFGTDAIGKDVELYEGYIEDSLSYSDELDFIIHTVAETRSSNMVERPVETLWTTISGTKNVLDLAKKKSVEGMVYLSSMEVFGRVEESAHRFKEEETGWIDLMSVRSSYPESKRMAENMCFCYYKECSVPVVIARLAQTFGAGVDESDSRVYSQFAKSAIAGEDIVLQTEGRSFGNYVYTADALAAIFMLLSNGERGEVYNIANEEASMTIREMAEIVSETITGGKSKVVFDPGEDNSKYAQDTKLRLDASKIMKMGWKPRYSIKDMYLRMIEESKFSR